MMVVQQKHACLSWQDGVNTAKHRAFVQKLYPPSPKNAIGGCQTDKAPDSVSVSSRFDPENTQPPE